MGTTGWEVPKISLLQVVDEASSLGIEYSHSAFSLSSIENNKRAYFDDIGPFAFIVPM